jgi:succinoglycan biosynthesis transport protein ExoP
MSIPQILAIFRARIWTAIMFTLVTFLVSVIALQFIPRRYDATAQIYFRLADRDPATNEPVPQMVMRNFLQTQMETIKSMGVALKVVEVLGLAKDPAQQKAFRANTGGNGDIVRWIAGGIVGNIRVDRVGSSDIIAVTYRDRDPKRAAVFANAYVTAYIKKEIDLRASPARDLFQWYEERLVPLRERLAELSSKRAELRQQMGMLEKDDAKGGASSDEVTKLSSESTSVRLELIQAKIALELLQSNPNQVSETEEMRQLRRQMTDVDAEIARTLRVVGPDHLRVKTLRLNRAALDDQMATVVKRGSADAVAAAKSRVETAERRLQEIRVSLQEGEQRAQSQAGGNSNLVSLDREIEGLKAQIGQIIERRERLELMGSVQQSLASRLIEAAAPSEPAFPKPLLVMAFALGLGIPFGLAFGFLREMFDRRVRHVDDITAFTELPILAVVPIDRKARLAA